MDKQAETSAQLSLLPLRIKFVDLEWLWNNYGMNRDWFIVLMTLRI